MNPRMGKKLGMITLTTSLLLATAETLLATTIPVRPSLTIFLESDRTQDSSKPAGTPDWSKVCNQLKNKMQNSSGTLGRGAFAKVSCLMTPTTLQKVSKSKRHKAEWVMRVLASNQINIRHIIRCSKIFCSINLCQKSPPLPDHCVPYRKFGCSRPHVFRPKQRV